MTPLRRGGSARLVPPVHAFRDVAVDPAFEVGFAEHLRQTPDEAALVALLDRFAGGLTDFDARMRRPRRC